MSNQVKKVYYNGERAKKVYWNGTQILSAFEENEWSASESSGVIDRNRDDISKTFANLSGFEATLSITSSLANKIEGSLNIVFQEQETTVYTQKILTAQATINANALASPTVEMSLKKQEGVNLKTIKSWTLTKQAGAEIKFKFYMNNFGELFYEINGESPVNSGLKFFNAKAQLTASNKRERNMSVSWRTRPV